MQLKRAPLLLLIGVIAIWQCSLVTAQSDLYLFNNGIAPDFSLVTDQPDRISCSAVTGKGINGGKAITALTKSYALQGDNCYIKFNSGHGNITAYTELEFFIRANPKNVATGYAGIELEDANHNLAGPNAVIAQTYYRYRFPIKNTFNGVNLSNMLSPFYLTLYLVFGEAIYADQVVLRSRNYFDIFTDATDQGREVIYSWGGSSCYVKSDSSAPEGTEVLSVPANTWGCGLFYTNPFLDLSYFTKIRFYLKSRVDVKIEIQNSNQKTAVTVPSTSGTWKQITLNLSQFGLDLHQTYSPFLITKIGDASQEAQVDRIRYIP